MIDTVALLVLSLLYSLVSSLKVNIWLIAFVDLVVALSAYHFFSRKYPEDCAVYHSLVPLVFSLLFGVTLSFLANFVATLAASAGTLFILHMLRILP